ncbi:MAG TPA: tetratricopeptide repeat protein [Candidatus Sulfotelmatobacter sp.]
MTLLPLHCQEPTSLRGAIRDAQGKPLADVTVQLRAQDASSSQTTHTDATGAYSFAVVQGGVYALRAKLAGYGDAEIAPLFFGPKEGKNIDLMLQPAHNAPAQPASAPKPEFFDQPQFTVSGVTDTTNFGGHGSDTVVRTRETLAKETASLSTTGPAAGSGAATEVEKTLRESLQRDPGNFDANHRLGRMLAESGKAREAIPYLEHARELKPGDFENAYDLSVANENAGNYESASDGAYALLVHSDKAELHHLLADSQEHLGNSLEAVREYQRAAELNPGEAYIFDWGSELLLHHAPEPALDVFAEGNRLFPRSVRMLIGLGAAWFARGSYDEAVQRICEASDLNPGDSTPYLFLGKMQSAQSAPSQQSVEKLHRFVTQQPENAQANYYYAVGLWKLRQGAQDAAGAAQVKTLLENAIRLDPKFAAAYLQLGILHSEQRNHARAISDYQQAIQADPQMEEAHYRLGQAYRRAGDAGKAEAELQTYDRLAKESAQNAGRERHEIRQFVYILRDQPPAQVP